MHKQDLKTADFDYELPPQLIAQEPPEQREGSRLMVLDRQRRAIVHDRFVNLGAYFRPEDILIANRSRVVPARILARKETGGAVELLLLRRRSADRWIAMARPSRRLRSGMRLAADGADLEIELEQRVADGQWLLRFGADVDVDDRIQQAARIALPPYIRSDVAPGDRYQTVYADRDGSIAAPTAGLHFSAQFIEHLQQRGISMHFVTLHVGPGTFTPVKAELVAEHRMHPEWGEVPANIVQAIERAKARGGRVVAVGTTTTRILETAAEYGLRPFAGETACFIYPGYRFKVVDALITNFHLPRSTLLMLVSALAGREFTLEAYRSAVQEGYRFFSFGDAMLIL